MTITIDLTKAAKTTFFAAFFLGSILAFAVALVEVAGL
ncbi:putative membrane protein [Pseudomonas aeruginosa]|nr:putative membrane protein [Pseudomonas aeruginosa]PRW16797.1 putative membrane protein [Pseudomonas aeruginosa]